MTYDIPTLPALPFARSYWVVPGRLLGGFYPGDRDPAVAEAKLNALLDCGVTHVFSLMEARETDHAGRRFFDYGPTLLRLASARRMQAVVRRFPIRDASVPGVLEMRSLLDAMDAALGAGGVLYLHCWGGRGRTGTAAGCWLARHGERDPLARLRHLTALAREHFQHVPETPVQRRLVQEWRAGL